jgi:hypothetical protein
MNGGAPITPDRIAVALVAACGITGVKPRVVFEDGQGYGNTRVLAAATCVARLGWSKRDAARVFRVHANRLTPSGLEIANAWPERVLVVAEALRAAGLIPDDVGGPPASPSPAAPAATPERKAGADAKRAGPARPETVAPPPASPPPERRPDIARRVRPKPTNPVRRASSTSRVTAIKPVNDRIVRWASQQVANGADLDFVAECFDVDPDALRAALEPMGIAA